MLTESLELEDSYLVEKCLRFIDKNANSIFLSPEFLNISTKELELIIQRDTLHLEEIKIFLALLRWGNKYLFPSF